ncbi:MAG: hypothetical protein IJL23_00870 [Alphaproteobacteria bacterium]|nr:hypothetical protein [Alphaproteobacteria bacterium]
MKKQNITLTPDIYFENVSKTLNMNIRSDLYAINEFTFAVAVIYLPRRLIKKSTKSPQTFLKLHQPQIKCWNWDRMN